MDVRAAGVASLMWIGCINNYPDVSDTLLGGQQQSMSPAAFENVKLDALREQVAADLGCTTAVSVDHVELDQSNTSEMYRVAACGRHEVYMLAMCQHEAGYTKRFVPVSSPVENPIRYASAHCTGPFVVSKVGGYAKLNIKGAADLHCPRGEVTPKFVYAGPRASSIPIAEGCGQRATYLPASLQWVADQQYVADLQLSSIVKL